MSNTKIFNSSFDKIIDKCIECYENNNNEKKIKETFINPIYNNLKKTLFPYICIIFILFISILLLVIIILIIIICK